MNPRVSILGCGWMGEPLAEYMLERNYIVKGSTTSKEKVNRLRSLGIHPFIIDINDEHLDNDFFNSDIIVLSLANKDVNQFRNLIRYIEKSPIQNTVFISSTSVYYNTNSITEEDADVKPCALSKIESLLISNKQFKTTVLRFGGLIGYERQPGNFFPKHKLVDSPEGFINMIHRDDCIQIIEQIIEQGVWNQTLNACADYHPSRRDFYSKAAIEIGKNVPDFNENSSNTYKIISIEKLKTLLDYQFKFPDL